MAIKSFPNNKDEFIGAEEVMRWLHGRTSGVYGADGNAAVEAVQGSMTVTVSDGVGWIANDNADGVVWWVDNEAESGNKLALDVDMADAVLPRIDRVIVSWATSNYADLPEVKILKGTPAAEPVAPTLTNDELVRQISLAAISIPAGTTAITSGMITDERLNPDVCGIVTESVKADTSMMYAQYLEAIEQLRNAIGQAWDGEISDGAITPEKLSFDISNAYKGVFTSDGWCQPQIVTYTKSYNGVVAPDLPDYDDSVYLFALMAKNTAGGFFVVVSTGEVVKNTDSTLYLYAKEDLQYCIYAQNADGTWRSSPVYEITAGNPISETVITPFWCNWDMVGTGGVTYLAKSDPVTVDSVAVDGVLDVLKPWVGQSVCVQIVDVVGVLADDHPIIDVDMSDENTEYSADKANELLTAWGCIGRVTVPCDGVVLAFCYGDAPTVAVPFTMKVVR